MTGDLEPIRTRDAAALVKRSPVTVRRWISKGWLLRIGAANRQALVDRAQVLAVDAALHRGETPPRWGACPHCRTPRRVIALDASTFADRDATLDGLAPCPGPRCRPLHRGAGS